MIQSKCGPHRLWHWQWHWQWRQQQQQLPLLSHRRCRCPCCKMLPSLCFLKQTWELVPQCQLCSDGSRLHSEHIHAVAEAEPMEYIANAPTDEDSAPLTTNHGCKDTTKKQR